MNEKMFKRKIYRHQKCSIFFNFIIAFIFQLSSFIISIQSKENNEYKIYKKNIWFIPIGIIIYLILGIGFSYIYSKVKWFIDYNWISLTKFFMIEILLALLINIIICLIETFIKCDENVKFFLCNIHDDKNNYYIDNILIFFQNIKNVYLKNKVDLIFLILLIVFFGFLRLLDNIFFLLILKNLHPEYFVFSYNIREVIVKIIFLFLIKIKTGYFFDKNGKDYKYRFTNFLDLIGDLLSFIGFLIYLEIIELNFCNLNYNLRRNIMKRSNDDILSGYSIDEEKDEKLFNDNNYEKNSELPNISIKK